VTKDRDRDTQIAVLPRRVVNLRQQRAPFPPGRQERFDRLTVPLKKC